VKGPRLTWPRTRLYGWTRAQLFWCAALWLANQWLLEQRRQYDAAMDALYEEFGRKLWALITRPSPIMCAIARSVGK
jgi:hypothetical protein